MKTALGHIGRRKHWIQSKLARMGRSSYNLNMPAHRESDRIAVFAVIVFIFVCYTVMFFPQLRLDGLAYIETARSIVIDGDLNTYNEKFYYSQPGWANVYQRQLFNSRNILVGFMNTPDFSESGYAFTFFPIGSTMYWLPGVKIADSAMRFLRSIVPDYALDGYSYPYLLVYFLWNLTWWFTGFKLIYELSRRYVSPVNAALASMIILGCGNIFPFLFIDICFSHGFDFFLIACALFMADKLSRSPSARRYFFSGFIAGFASTVRYQNIVLLVFPFVEWMDEFRCRSAPRDILFRGVMWVLGCAVPISSQLIYWYIIHGKFVVGPETMGTGSIPTFNPMAPQLIQMLFSNFHGLLSWMPFLFFGFLGLLILPLRSRRFGLTVLAVMIITTYYNASRSEWWNLGFGVRRFSGYLPVLILGMSVLLQSIRSRWLKWSLVSMCCAGIIWNIAFMIQFYDNVNLQVHGPGYYEVLGDPDPYSTPRFSWIGPQWDRFDDILSVSRNWYAHRAFVLKDLTSLLENQQGSSVWKLGFWLTLFLIPAVSGSIFMRIARRIPESYWINILFLSVVLWASTMLILHSKTETIHALRMNRNPGQQSFQPVRIRRGSVYWGDNPSLTESLVMNVQRSAPMKIKEMHVLCYRQDPPLNGPSEASDVGIQSCYIELLYDGKVHESMVLDESDITGASPMTADIVRGDSMLLGNSIHYLPVKDSPQLIDQCSMAQDFSSSRLRPFSIYFR